MEVQIIAHDKETEEYRYALQLRKECESFLLSQNRKDKKDYILIIPNFNLYLGDVCGISLFVCACFDTGFKNKLMFKCTDNISGNIDKKHEENLFQNLYFSSFCFAINIVKETAESLIQKEQEIWVESLNIEVNDYLRKMSVSTHKFIKENSKINPFITSCIAFKNIAPILKKRIPPYHLLCRGLPTWKDIQEIVALEQGGIKKENSQYPYFSLTSNLDIEKIQKIGELSSYLADIRAKIGPLTKQKLDVITKLSTANNKYFQSIGNKLVILKGGAGTGKTMKLLEIANKFSRPRKKCLILSYNRALVQDINRLLRIEPYTDDWKRCSVQAQTIHSYFYSVLNEIIVWQKEVEEENKNNFNSSNKATYKDYIRQICGYAYLNNYNQYLTEAKLKLDEGGEPLQANSLWQKNRKDYNYILIDEAQDWLPAERDILYKQFGAKNFIVSIGEQQLIRTHKPLFWDLCNGESVEATTHQLQKKSLRQNTVFCSFQRYFADIYNIPWEIEINEELKGGRIIIHNGEMSGSIAKVLKDSTTNYSKDKYDDILFLVPSDLVHKETKDFSYKNDSEITVIKGIKDKEFSLNKKWKEDFNIDFFDMTLTSNYDKQPKTGEYRLMNYESCRGLESFAVVAIDMDVFFDEKIKYYNEDSDSMEQDLFSQDRTQKAIRYAAMWSLIVFSRPVELLFITIRNKNSYFYRYLQEIASIHPELIEFV